MAHTLPLRVAQKLATRSFRSQALKLFSTISRVKANCKSRHLACVSDVSSHRDSISCYSTLANTAGESVAVESVTLSAEGQSCIIKWNDGFQSRFHSVWLRHNCHCKLCRHATGQKLINPVSVSTSNQIESINLEGDQLIISWSGPQGIHNGHIPLKFLHENNYNEEMLMAKRRAVKCNKAVAEIPRISYEEIWTDKGRLRWLQKINEDGMCLVQGVPTGDEEVSKVAELIGPVLNTIYGTTFDVITVEDPINVAYSEIHLDLHQDLAYFESPPGLQLLHCLKFDECVTGGESAFLDVFTIADEFRINHPTSFETLTTVPATFQKVHYSRDYPTHIVNQKPHIKLNHMGEIVAVYWAPPFEGPLAVREEDVERYFQAYEIFAKSIMNSPHVLQHRLQPGELVIFNNLRMLHGRRHFTVNGGTRHLKGCYVNIDIFKSMTQVQNNLVGDGRLAKRVGNQCWF